MALSNQKPPKGNRVAIMTISGGPCVVAGDVCESSGIEVPPFPQNLQRQILELTPPFAAPSNPVDMTPQMNPANYKACVDLVVGQKKIDGVIAINVGLDREEFADAFIHAMHKYDKPITSFTIDTPRLSERFKEAGIPIYPTPERAVTAYRALVRFAGRSLTNKFLKKRRAKSASHTLRTFLERNSTETIPEAVAKKILSEYGVPSADEQVVRIWSSTLRAAQDLGYPLAMKVHSPTITHKSDIGAVILHINDENTLREAWEQLTRAFPNDDLLLQRMVPPGLEIIVGAKRDPVFGPMAAVGLGGVFVEIFQDLALGTCPLENKQAKKMLESLRAYPLLKGYRSNPGVDENSLIAVLLSVSDFMLANPNVVELDINPIIASGDRLTAVDALIRVKL
jgi:acetyltransferase